MKLLFYKWLTTSENRITEAFSHLKDNLGNPFEITEYRYKTANYDFDMQLAKELLFLVHQNSCDALFSVNYFPVLSEVALTADIPYYAWIQDSPNLTLYSPTITNKNNHIFSFDSAECQRLRSKADIHVQYLPLASDPVFWKKQLTNSTFNANHKISFLGSSYKNCYYDKAKHLSNFERGYYDGIMTAASQIYGSAIVESSLSEEYARRLLEACDVHLPDKYLYTNKELAAYILEQKITAKDRQELITLIAEKYPIDVYSSNNDWKHPGITNLGYADYESQMPVIFHNSAINLNFSLRTIHSGIPLRILDVLGCEGFLITNYQSDLLEHFVLDEELVIFEDKDDLITKVDYYMTHEDIRQRIASAGLRKIEKYFTYEYQLSQIFS